MHTHGYIRTCTRHCWSRQREWTSPFSPKPIGRDSTRWKVLGVARDFSTPIFLAGLLLRCLHPTDQLQRKRLFVVKSLKSSTSKFSNTRCFTDPQDTLATLDMSGVDPHKWRRLDAWATSTTGSELPAGEPAATGPLLLGHKGPSYMRLEATEATTAQGLRFLRWASHSGNVVPRGVAVYAETEKHFY